ncbi:unnamed protein product [Polarella glacialis]|uniref:Uncharacterized protein n=1 Tax=Polarella glacialis TaxID=89957 RepID=A0A813DKQ9_POLGL|nr:unnamed protein product [Polarella glacialis]
MSRVMGPLAFYRQYAASGSDFLTMYHCALLPLYYIFGLLYIVFKALILNPPCLQCFLSTLRFETDASFPGCSPRERMAFAKHWYSTVPRQPQYQQIRSRFTHLPERSLWVERFAIAYPLLVLPPQAQSAVFDEEHQEWHLVASWWSPHFAAGWLVVGERPDQNGWMIAGEFQCWFFLKWFYKWLLVRVLESYVDQMADANGALPPAELR